jgi:hypothetical protein
MITSLFGGPYSGQTMHLPQNTHAFVVRKIARLYESQDKANDVVGEYRQYDSDGTNCHMIWFDPSDIEEAKKAVNKDERHAAQDLMRALRAAREAGTEAAREEGARKAAAIQAWWEANMSDSMREQLEAARAQAHAEAAAGAHFDSTDEERWTKDG